MNKCTLTCLILLALFSCTKQDFPDEGLFIGTFTGSYTKDGNVVSHERIINILIMESTEDHLLFINSESGASHQESELIKNGKNISGTIKSYAVVSRNDSPTTHISHIDKYIDVEGQWEKVGGEYLITGTFKSFYRFVSTAANIDEEYPVEGSFIIQPNNE